MWGDKTQWNVLEICKLFLRLLHHLHKNIVIVLPGMVAILIQQLQVKYSVDRKTNSLIDVKQQKTLFHHSAMFKLFLCWPYFLQCIELLYSATSKFTQNLMHLQNSSDLQVIGLQTCVLYNICMLCPCSIPWSLMFKLGLWIFHTFIPSRDVCHFTGWWWWQLVPLHA